MIGSKPSPLFLIRWSTTLALAICIYQARGFVGIGTTPPSSSGSFRTRPRPARLVLAVSSAVRPKNNDADADADALSATADDGVVDCDDDRRTTNDESNNDSEEGGSTEQQQQQQQQPNKPMSRLAMAAADWMEEEDDELFAYWDRFDEARSGSKKYDNSQQQQQQAEEGDEEGPDDDDAGTLMSTDERLDRYFKSRGIDKSAERKHAREIERALTSAKSASSAYDAIRTLEKVRPYLQAGSKLGGSALLELAYAYQANDGSDDDDDDSGEEEAARICRDILEYNSLRELRTKARQLMADPERYGKRSYNEKKKFWYPMFDSWWS